MPLVNRSPAGCGAFLSATQWPARCTERARQTCSSLHVNLGELAAAGRLAKGPEKGAEKGAEVGTADLGRGFVPAFYFGHDFLNCCTFQPLAPIAGVVASAGSIKAEESR